ncbi:MarR family winged helix-turn-helix transcriptional regulator [Niallia endozanthoxylica]|uniref:Winged helix-turn-helix transcriptional regulator n=1 Tax=Niallia endozanthoxylica TaxID=2036016 RepID=A0A5J5HSM5_9BACI|nr:MarR family winged helix-turn-helix transcriptional regulator [Niallia endozanthoxylica]KAA9023861.1 winged helix-turn-helix transcriptional regulator [Niallia endozanthoxylica]
MESGKEFIAKSHLVFSFVRGLFLLLEDDLKKKIKHYGLAVPGFRILWILYFENKMNMSELSFIAQTNISNIYRQLIKLKDQHLVDIDNGEDARIREISLTVNGQQYIHDFLSKHVSATDLQIISILKKMPKEDLDKFIEVAARLSSELIGKPFTDWVTNTADKIMEI